MPDHDISLDDLLADAIVELKAIEMLSLARAVQIARERLSAGVASVRPEQLDLPIDPEVSHG